MIKYTLLLKLAVLVPHTHYRHIVSWPMSELEALLVYYKAKRGLGEYTGTTDALDRAVDEMHKEKKFSGPDELHVPKDMIKRNRL